jgi:hypothetical protein
MDISVLINGTIDITWYTAIGFGAITGILISVILIQYHYYNYIKKG